MSFIEKLRVYLRLKLKGFTDFVSYLFEHILFAEEIICRLTHIFRLCGLKKVFYMIVTFTQFMYNAEI